MSVAHEILNQLGGNRFIVMTGAKNFSSSGNTLMFRLPSKFALKGINYVTITLDPSDTYSVVFYKVRGTKAVEISKETDVYCDTLQETFSHHTGLYTRL